MRKTVGEFIVDYLIDQGIEYVIGIPGHGCLAFFDALRDRSEKGLIKYLQIRQEMSAVHLADGYFRTSGKPLAVFTSIGAGALNTVIGLGTSFVDSTPVLMLMGDAHSHMKGVGLLQEFERKQDSDILSVFRPITKRCWRIETREQAPRILKRAFNSMMEGRKGPVVISMPMDIQAQEIEVPKKNLISLPVLRTGVDPLQIEEALKIMRKAKRPLIVAGGGALYRRASEELVKLAETWGAAVVTTMAGKGVFPEDHPLYGWHGGSKGTEAGNYLCRNADVVLALGCRFADETTSSYRKGATYNMPKTRLIHVDIDGGELGKNYPCDAVINADLKAAAAELARGLEGSRPDYKSSEYFKDIQKAKQQWLDKLKGIIASSGDRLTISKILKEIGESYPRDALVVVSSGNGQAQILQEYSFKTPYTLITTGGFSTMGFALPAALGAKLARPDTPVLAIAGDGDFMMTMQEMSIAKQYGINIIILVLNNCGWMAIRDLQLDVYGKNSDFGNYFALKDGSPYSPDFCAAAKAFGLQAEKITRLNQFKPALEKALKANEPFLIEADVTSDYPYSGGIATGWWDVPVPAYMKEKLANYNKGVSEEYLL